MMKYLILISTILILSVSCRTGAPGGLKEIGKSNVDNIQLSAYFQLEEFSKVLFTAEITVKDVSLSGLIMFKRVEDGSHRVTCFNELGMNYFDMEVNFEKSEFKHIAEVVNHEIILKSLKNDIGLILMHGLSSQPAIIYYDKNNVYTIYKFDSFEQEEKYGIDYYFINKNSGKLEKIEVYDSSLKVLITFKELDSGFPGRITIEHNDFDFKIVLKIVKQ